jgi:HEAT repeat protein
MAEPEFLGRKLTAWSEQLQSDPVPRKRRAAALALGQIAVDSPENRQQAVVLLSRTVQKDSEYAVRQQALSALIALPVEAVEKFAPDFASALGQETDAQLKRQIAILLGRIGPAAQVGLLPLRKSLDHADAAVRASAAEAIGQIGGAAGDSEQLLLRKLKDSVPSVRQYAAMALGSLELSEPAQVGAGLRQLLESQNEVEVQRAALDSLRRLRRDDPLTVELFGKYASSQDRSIREIALLGITALGPAARATDAALQTRLRDEQEQNLRIQCIHALGRIWSDNSTKLVERLKESLRSDRDWQVRVAAAEELGGLGIKGIPAKQLLESARRDPQLQVREAASNALRQIEQPIPKK